MRRALLLFFCLLAGTIVGALIAYASADVPGLSWLAFSRHVGINPEAPFVLDFSILKFVFGFSLNVSVAQIISIALSIIIYNFVTKRRR